MSTLIPVLFRSRTMSPDELVYLGVLAASIPVGFLFRYLSEWLHFLTAIKKTLWITRFFYISMHLVMNKIVRIHIAKYPMVGFGLPSCFCERNRGGEKCQDGTSCSNLIPLVLHAWTCVDPINIECSILILKMIISGLRISHNESALLGCIMCISDPIWSPFWFPPPSYPSRSSREARRGLAVGAVPHHSNLSDPHPPLFGDSDWNMANYQDYLAVSALSRSISSMCSNPAIVLDGNSSTKAEGVLGPVPFLSP